MTELQIRCFHANGVHHVHVSGELDLANVDDFTNHLNGCSNGEGIVVDTTELRFIDSTGLAALVRERNERGQDLFSLVAGPATERLLDLSLLREFFGLGGKGQD